jgi:hypothetical protein
MSCRNVGGLGQGYRCLGVCAVEWRFGLKHLLFVLAHSRWLHTQIDTSKSRILPS